jgi:hypothetical protein
MSTLQRADAARLMLGIQLGDSEAKLCRFPAIQWQNKGDNVLFTRI